MTTPVTVKFADYAPDASRYNPAVTDYLRNLVPQGDGYGPFPGWSAFGTALPARCRGGITVRKSDGSAAIYAGTATNLYRFNAATSAWVSVTRVAGGAYAVPDTADWCFTLFGNKLIATNGFDDNQFIDIDGGTNFAALTNSPKAFYCCTSGDFLWLGRLTSYPKSVAWSGNNDSTYWTYGYKGSDQQELADGGLVRGIMPVGNDVIILQDDGRRVAERIGGNLVYKIAPITEGIGCYAPYSAISVRSTIFWYGPGGFFEGVNATPIGFEKVDRMVRKEADTQLLREMRGFYDPDRNMVGWIIRKTGGTSFILGYNWALKKWTRIEIDMDFIFPAISPGYTIGDLATLGYTMNNIPYPFDAAFWSGTGIRTLSGFTSAGAFGWFQSTPPAARVETVDLEFVEGEAAFTNRFKLVGDPQNAYLTGAIGVRKNHGDATLVYTPTLTAVPSTGFMWGRKRGAVHRFRVDIAQHDWGNVSGVRAWMRKGGLR